MRSARLAVAAAVLAATAMLPTAVFADYVELGADDVVTGYVNDETEYIDDGTGYIDDGTGYIDDGTGYIDDGTEYVDDDAAYTDDGSGYVDLGTDAETVPSDAAGVWATGGGVGLAMYGVGSVVGETAAALIEADAIGVASIGADVAYGGDDAESDDGGDAVETDSEAEPVEADERHGSAQDVVYPYEDYMYDQDEYGNLRWLDQPTTMLASSARLLAAAAPSTLTGTVYASFDSSTKELRFFRSTTPYANGSTSGTLTYYTVDESGSPDLPNWASVRGKVETVTFAGYVKPACTKQWFYNMKKLTRIDGMETYLDTSVCENFDAMFRYCESLETLDLSGFYVKDGARFAAVFNYMSSLTTVKLGSDFKFQTRSDIYPSGTNDYQCKLPSGVWRGPDGSDYSNKQLMNFYGWWGTSGCAMNLPSGTYTRTTPIPSGYENLPKTTLDVDFGLISASDVRITVDGTVFYKDSDNLIWTDVTKSSSVTRNGWVQVVWPGVVVDQSGNHYDLVARMDGCDMVGMDYASYPDAMSVKVANVSGKNFLCAYSIYDRSHSTEYVSYSGITEHMGVWVQDSSGNMVDGTAWIFVNDLDVGSRYDRNNGLTSSASTSYGGPHAEGVNVISGMDSITLTTTTTCKKETYASYTRVTSDENAYVQNDAESEDGGFVARFRGTEASFDWTGGTQCATIFGFGYTPAVCIASSGEGGSISDPGVTDVPWKWNQSYTAVAETGYRLKSCAVDGVDRTSQFVANGYTWTFSNVVSDHTIHVEWEPEPVGKLQVVKTGGGTYVDPSSRNKNSYALTGAVYRIYRTRAAATAKSTGYLTADYEGATAVLTAASDGKTNVVTLETGTYYVVEITPSKGYGLDAEVHEVVVSQDATSSVASTEPPMGAGPTLAKVDSTALLTTPQGAASFGGAVFEVSHYDAEGSSVGSATATATARWTTDANGRIDFSSGPSSGTWPYKDADGNLFFPIGVYTLQEVEAPTGYTVNSETWVFRVDRTGSDAAGYSAAVSLKSGTQSAKAVSGYDFRVPQTVRTIDVVIDDLDADQSDHDQGDADVYASKYQIRLAAGSNSIKINGGTIYAGELVGTVSYDSSTGTWHMNGLPYANYVISQSKAPDNYRSTGTTYDLTAGTASTYSFTFENPVYRYPLTIVKTDSETGDPVDATFKITNSSIDAVTWNGSTYAVGSDVTTVTTTGGRVTVDDLPYGTYTVVETSVATGFTVTPTYSVSGNGKAIESTTSSSAVVVLHGGDATEATLSAKDDPARGDVEIKKLTIYGELTPGATYTIYNASGRAVWAGVKGGVQTLVQNGGEVCKITTGSDSIAKTTGGRLRYGTYRVVETSAPRGFDLDEVWEKTFSITEDGQVVDLTGGYVTYDASGNRIYATGDVQMETYTAAKMPVTGAGGATALLVVGATSVAAIVAYGMRRRAA